MFSRRAFKLSEILAACALSALAAVGCKSGGHQASSALAPSTSPSPTVVVQTEGRPVPFRVELAVTPEEQARGLMFRQHLDPDAGMLFVNDRPRIQKFWMKNTLIPLDMIFIGADRRIAGIVENATPLTETERMVPVPSQYVLEIGGGIAGHLGIHSGEQVDFRGIAPASEQP